MARVEPKPPRVETRKASRFGNGEGVSPSRPGYLGSVVSSPAGSGAEAQPYFS